MANTSIPSLPGPGGRPGKGVFGFGAAGLAVAGLALILQIGRASCRERV